MPQPVKPNHEEVEDNANLSILLSQSISVIRKNFLLFIIILITCPAIGGLIYFLRSPVYSSSMIFKSEILTVKEFYSLLTPSDEFTQTDNSYYPEKLGITPGLQQKIKKVSVKKVENNEMFCRISVSVYDKNILDSLQNSIVNYFESNQYLQLRIHTKKEAINDLLLKINQQINALEKITTDSQNVLLTNPLIFNPYVDLVTLYEKKSEYDQQLKTIKPLQVIEGFQNVQITSFNLLFHVIIGFIAGLFLIALIIWFEVQRLSGMFTLS